MTYNEMPVQVHTDAFNFEQWRREQTWREVVPVLTDNPVLAATIYLSVLAHPDRIDWRNQFVDAIRSWADILTGNTPNMRRRDIERAINRACKKIEERMKAQKVAVDLLLSSRVFGEPSRMRADTPSTVRAALARINDSALTLTFSREPSSATKTPRVDYVDVNAMKRVWGPSKPVLPIALSLYDAASRQSTQPWDVGALLRESDWVFGAIDSLPQQAYLLNYANIVAPSEMIILDLQ